MISVGFMKMFWSLLRLLIHYHSQITFVCLNVSSGLTDSSDDSS